jgi:hypothetical protein
MNDQIWGLQCNLKFQSYCLAFLVAKFQKRERNLNLFLAIASSGSIGAWAIWQQIPMVWASIIAGSQILTVVKPYFPFYKYAKDLMAKCSKAEILNIEMERLWYKVQTNKITEDEASELYFDLKKQVTELFNSGDDTAFDVNKSIEEKANKKMAIFLKNTYGIQITLNS